MNLTISLANRPQMACEMLTTGGVSANYASMPTWLWIGPISTYTYTTSHMANPKRPAGVNIGMLDGHVEWRTFNSPLVKPRAGDGTAPIYYY